VGRSGGSAIALEEIAREADEILEPHRLESQFRPELAKLVGNFVLEEIIARHDGHGRCAQFSLRAQPSQKAKTVNDITKGGKLVKGGKCANPPKPAPPPPGKPPKGGA